MIELTPEARIGALLNARGQTICTAESCTGGLIASRLTDVPGSSTYVLGGIIAYANAIKQTLLRVPGDLLMTHGAVSEPVALAMAVGALDCLGADYALSVTGIAGPGGGTTEKPVGLTYIGLAVRGGTPAVRRYVWTGDRLANKASSADAALEWLIEHLTQGG